MQLNSKNACIGKLVLISVLKTKHINIAVHTAEIVSLLPPMPNTTSCYSDSKLVCKGPCKPLASDVGRDYTERCASNALVKMSPRTPPAI